MIALETLARKLLRAELAARGARDLDLAEALLSTQLRLDPETGEYVGIERDGTDRINIHAAGCPAMGLEDVLAETMKAKPEIFGGQSVPPGRVGQPPAVNPFMPGPRHNLTAAMQLYRENPELARELALDAGIKLDLER